MTLVAIAILVLLLAAAVYAVNLFRAQRPSAPAPRWPRSRGPAVRRRRSGGTVYAPNVYTTTSDDEPRRRDNDATILGASYVADGPAWGHGHRTGGSWDDGPSSSSDSSSSSGSDWSASSDSSSSSGSDWSASSDSSSSSVD